MLKKTTLKITCLATSLAPALACSGFAFWMLPGSPELSVVLFVVGILPLTGLLVAKAYAGTRLPKAATILHIMLYVCWVALWVFLAYAASSSRIVGVHELLIAVSVVLLLLLAVWVHAFVEFIKNFRSNDLARKNQAYKFRKTLLWFLTGLALYCTMSGAVVYLNRNYAAEIAAPIEAKLARHGVIKRCSDGKNGRGRLADRQPSYSAYYEITKSQEEATAVILQSFKDAGYNLALREQDDTSIHSSYVDSSRSHSYTNLEDGEIGWYVDIYTEEGSEAAMRSCGGAFGSVAKTPDAIVIAIRVDIPRFKP